VFLPVELCVEERMHYVYLPVVVKNH